jgi:hypothetical protein
VVFVQYADAIVCVQMDSDQPKKKVYNDCLVQYSTAKEAMALVHSSVGIKGNRFIKIHIMDFNVIPIADIPELTPEEVEAEKKEQHKAMGRLQYMQQDLLNPTGEGSKREGAGPGAGGGRFGQGRGGGRFGGRFAGASAANTDGNANANSNNIVGFGRGRGGFGSSTFVGGRGPPAAARGAGAGPGGRFTNKRYVAGQTPAPAPAATAPSGRATPSAASTISDDAASTDAVTGSPRPTTGTGMDVSATEEAVGEKLDSTLYGDLDSADGGVEASAAATASDPYALGDSAATTAATGGQRPRMQQRPKPSPHQQAAAAKNNMALAQKFEELKKLRSEAETIWRKKETLILVRSYFNFSFEFVLICMLKLCCQAQIDQYKKIIAKHDSTSDTVDSLESKILNLQGQLQALREQRDKAANVTA